MAFYCSVGTWDIFCNRAIRLPHSLQQRHHGKDIHHQPNQTHHAKQQRFPLHKPTPHKTRAYGTASTPQAPELCHRRINAMILTSPCYVKPRQDFVTKNYRSGPPTQQPRQGPNGAKVDPRPMLGPNGAQRPTGALLGLGPSPVNIGPGKDCPWASVVLPPAYALGLGASPWALGLVWSSTRPPVPLGPRPSLVLGLGRGPWGCVSVWGLSGSVSGALVGLAYGGSLLLRFRGQYGGVRRAIVATREHLLHAKAMPPAHSSKAGGLL
jgi:hypothetical protein